MKILYCVAGMWHCAVIESEILKRDELFISAKRAFSLEPDQVGIATPRNQINLKLVFYSNVIISCSFISDLHEQSAFYKGIMEFMDKEASREN